MSNLYKLSLCLVLFSLLACDGAISIGGRTVGMQSGKFITHDGFFQVIYPHSYERSLAAAEKAMHDLGAKDIRKDLRIGRGEIRGMVREETVVITVDFIRRDETAVAVRVGAAGNRIASQMILERVTTNLSAPLKSGKSLEAGAAS